RCPGVGQWVVLDDLVGLGEVLRLPAGDDDVAVGADEGAGLGVTLGGGHVGGLGPGLGDRVVDLHDRVLEVHLVVAEIPAEAIDSAIEDGGAEVVQRDRQVRRVLPARGEIAEVQHDVHADVDIVVYQYAADVV